MDVMDYDPITNPSLRTQHATSLHGILMALPFLILFPPAILLARHKQLIINQKVRNTQLWFVIHAVFNLVGSLMMIAGIIIAYQMLPVSPMPSGSVGVAHKVLGLLAFALIWVQVLIAGFRPAPDAPRRAAFNLLHHNLGRVTILVGWTAMYLGIYTHHHPLGQTSSLISHSAAFGAWTALLLLVDLVLWSWGRRAAVSPKAQQLEEGSPDASKLSAVVVKPVQLIQVTTAPKQLSS